MVQPTMASSCCKVSPGGHPWEAIKHSFCIIFFVCWEETRFWKPKTPLLSWLCYKPIDLSLPGPQIRKIFRNLNLWVVPKNLKYKNKKWFYVIHLFNPLTSETVGINGTVGWENPGCLLGLGLGLVGWFVPVCPRSLLLYRLRFISTVYSFSLIYPNR